MIEQKKNILILQVFFLFVYFGSAGITSFLSVYLSEDQGLNGYQIGTIMSIGPIVMIFFQPIWGMLSDMTNAPTKVISFLCVTAGVLGLGYLVIDDYHWLIFLALFFAIFQSGINPISDSIALKYTGERNLNYGSIRLFGSLGFGLAVYLIGKLSETPLGLDVIFYALFVTLLLAAIIVMKAPKERAKQKLQLKEGIKKVLLLPKFILFIASAFLIFGPNLANNTYFGLFVEDSGGTFAGIGTAFLIAVLSEIPFMQAAKRWIERIGVLNVMLIAGIVSFVRWGLYVTEPALWIIYATAVLQGAAIGLFIPAGLQYVRDVTPVQMTATAVTLYTSVAHGFGTWFSTFFGGIVYEVASIFSVYLFFGILAIIGIILNLWLIKLDKKNDESNPSNAVGF
ncbi:PPP family 3-phenylpropionic acid transporter [Bacillus oleivorans]|uniref:PPP family 3-phenylpropionic acid transporter n=1 Tax=Bacillus oleivorans TaxID=1448271 RepID=A0A285CLN6_9BACI|nr:MFS transporter [Bacillus oleivorans]SNX68451.1 PPP family 3-phenylpropionic acid transporter [Bacillus oleivorans]